MDLIRPPSDLKNRQTGQGDIYIYIGYIYIYIKGGSRIFERGVHLRSTSKKKGGGGGPRGGLTLGPMLKSLHRGPKGGAGPPAPPGSATEYIYIYMHVYPN